MSTAERLQPDVIAGYGLELRRWDEFQKLKPKVLREKWEVVKSDRKIRESLPTWLDDLGEAELGTERWHIFTAFRNEEDLDQAHSFETRKLFFDFAKALLERCFHARLSDV